MRSYEDRTVLLAQELVFDHKAKVDVESIRYAINKIIEATGWQCDINQCVKELKRRNNIQDQFIVRILGENTFYTGKSGEGFASSCSAHAFIYATKVEAELVANRFNGTWHRPGQIGRCWVAKEIF